MLFFCSIIRTLMFSLWFLLKFPVLATFCVVTYCNMQNIFLLKCFNRIYSSVEKGPDQWNESSSIMYSALKDAAIRARTDGELSADDAQTFIRSGRLNNRAF